MSEQWECFLCCKDEDDNTLPTAYLSNLHPLCHNCGDSVLRNEKHIQRHRLTYHIEFGDIIIASNIPIVNDLICKN